MRIMNQFWTLMKESTLTQAFITVILTLVYAYMLITAAQIPAEFHAAYGLVLGFFFGGKMGFAQGQTAERKSQTRKEE